MPYDPNQLDEPLMQVRHLMGDVYEFEFLSDNEIQFSLDNNAGDVFQAAADCCKAIAARLARNTDFKFSTLWQDSSQAMKHFLDLAEVLKDQAVDKKGFEVAFTGDYDSEPIFDIGQFDHRGTRQRRSHGLLFRE